MNAIKQEAKKNTKAITKMHYQEFCKLKATKIILLV
jgi:hypothetical protein